MYTPELELQLLPILRTMGKPVVVNDSGEAAEALEEFAERAPKTGKGGRKRPFDVDRDIRVEVWNGDDASVELADAMIEAKLLKPSTVEQFFEELADLQDWEKAAAFYAVTDLGYTDMTDIALKVRDELRPMDGDAKEYVQDYIDGMGGVGELGEDVILAHFDYEKFGRDIRSDEENRLQENIEEAEADGDEEQVENLREYLEELEAKSDQEFGEHFADEYGTSELATLLGDNLEHYFDLDSWVRDWEAGGDLTSFEFDGRTWTISAHEG